MSTLATERRRPSREQALAIAARRKAERQRRTGRIRKGVAVLAVCAFIGPFAVIYEQIASGKDPGLAASQTKTTAAASTRTAGSATTSSGSTSSPVPVTTQQS